MMRTITVSSILTCGITLLVGGCTNAIIYGEGTNISIASLRLNDDVAQPISVNSALDRTVAAIVPRTADKREAVNMVSGFQLDHDDTTGGLFGTLTIKTVFASGSAAKDLAENKPAVAANILNLSYVEPASDALRARRQKAIAAIDAITEDSKLRTIATEMGVFGNSSSTKSDITTALSSAPEKTFDEYAAVLGRNLGGSF